MNHYKKSHSMSLLKIQHVLVFNFSGFCQSCWNTFVTDLGVGVEKVCRITAFQAHNESQMWSLVFPVEEGCCDFNLSDFNFTFFKSETEFESSVFKCVLRLLSLHCGSISEQIPDWDTSVKSAAIYHFHETNKFCIYQE